MSFVALVYPVVKQQPFFYLLSACHSPNLSVRDCQQNTLQSLGGKVLLIGVVITLLLKMINANSMFDVKS